MECAVLVVSQVMRCQNQHFWCKLLHFDSGKIRDHKLEKDCFSSYFLDWNHQLENKQWNFHKLIFRELIFIFKKKFQLKKKSDYA